MKKISFHVYLFDSSPVLQVSLVETKKGTKLMSVAGDLGSINYRKVSDRLLNLLN